MGPSHHWYFMVFFVVFYDILWYYGGTNHRKTMEKTWKNHEKPWKTMETPWKHHGKKHENPMGISTWMKPQIAGSGRWAPWASLGKAVSRGCGRSQWVYDRLWMAMAYLSESILSILLQSHKWKWEIQRLVEIMIWDKRFIALFTILIHVPLPSAKLGAQKARSVTRIGTAIWPSWKVWRALPKTTHLITPSSCPGLFSTHSSSIDSSINAPAMSDTSHI